jgi:hypothetical protein
MQAYMLAVETGVPRLFPLRGILTAATPCDTIKKPNSSLGGSLQIDPLPIKPLKNQTVVQTNEFYFYLSQMI